GIRPSDLFAVDCVSQRYELAGHKIELAHLRHLEHEVPHVGRNLAHVDECGFHPSAPRARSSITSSNAGWPSSGGVISMGIPLCRSEISRTMAGRSLSTCLPKVRK